MSITIVLLFWASLHYPRTIGLSIFALAVLNYLILLAFRLANNLEPVGERPSTESVTAVEDSGLFFSILVPLKREGDVVVDTMNAIANLDYPAHLQEVIIIVEETDIYTRDALGRISLPANARICLIPELAPFTKARALLHGLEEAKGDYLTVYDAESRPEPKQLRKAALRLSSAKKRLCLQARIRINNKETNWISRNFSAEYYEWYERHLQRLSLLDRPFGLGGNSFFVSKKEIEAAGAWDPFNVTEDADMAVRLIENGVAMQLLDSETTEDCPVRMDEWINQRTRWNKGLLVTQMIHLPRAAVFRTFGNRGWVHFWLPMICAGLLPFFNAFIPVFIWFSRLPFEWILLMSALLWVLLLASVVASALINRMSYRKLGISTRLAATFADALRYLGLHFVAGFKAWGEYFLAPLHWYKTPHEISEKETVILKKPVYQN